MAKPNYSFEKRQRELAKKKKKEEKLKEKAERKTGPGGGDEPGGDSEAADGGAAAADQPSGQSAACFSLWRGERCAARNARDRWPAAARPPAAPVRR